MTRQFIFAPICRFGRLPGDCENRAVDATSLTVTDYRWDEQVDRLLGSFLDPSPFPQTHRVARPAAVAWEDGEALYVELEIPGVKNERIDLSVENSKRTIKVEPPPEAEPKDRGERYLRRER